MSHPKFIVSNQKKENLKYTPGYNTFVVKMMLTTSIIIEVNQPASEIVIIDIEKVGQPVSNISGNNTFVVKNDDIQVAR